MPDEVRLDVGPRIFDRVTDAGLGAKVDDTIEIGPIEGALECNMIGKIDSLETEFPGVELAKLVQPRFLEPRVVLIVHVVDADDARPARQQPGGDVITDESGCACNESGHSFSDPIEPRRALASTAPKKNSGALRIAGSSGDPDRSVWNPTLILRVHW